MKFSATAILLVLLTSTSEAFQPVQPRTVRSSVTSLNSVSSFVKYILVPNAKTPVVSQTFDSASSSSASDAVTSATTTAATAAPTAAQDFVASIPSAPEFEVVPEPSEVAKMIETVIADPAVASRIMATTADSTANLERATSSTSSFTSLLDYITPTSPGEPGTAPLMYEYIRDLLLDSKSGDTSPVFPREKFAALWNSLRAVPSEFPQEKFAATWTALHNLPSDLTVQDIVNAFNVKELGGWYAGIFTLFVLAYSTTSSSSLSGKLAGVSASTTRQTPVKAPPAAAVGTPESEGEVSLLMEVVEELKKLKAERSKMDDDFADLRKEMKSMKATIQKDKKVEKTLRSKLEVSEKTNKEQAKKLKSLEGDKVRYCAATLIIDRGSALE